MQNDDVRTIKERLDILDIVGDKVRLRKAGRGYVGLCPFHDEKTPSFHVSQERQNYHCFGCGKGGDIFTFVMETEGLDFRQALELLAERAGVRLTAPEGKKKNSGSLYSVMELASKFFRSQLNGPDSSIVKAYLARRRLSGDDASRFELGWCSSSWDSLWRSLSAAGVSRAEALEAGLALENQRGGLYDRFRGRLMFPIRDISGRLIAFGGRIVDGDGAKYINSPEGPLYSKSHNLYLLNVAKNAIRERGRAILVEGYMDALRLHLHGYTETVASLGTSLTEGQASLVKRFASRCYICYDSDSAGQEATLRGMYILQTLGLDVYVLSLPAAKDPDELLSAEGGEELFKSALDNARPLILQHLFAVRARLDDPAQRMAAVNSLMDGLAQLPPSMISPYASQAAAELGFYPRQLWEELEKHKKGALKSTADARQGKTAAVPVKRERPMDQLEAALCSLLWHDDARRSAVHPQELLPLLADPRAQELLLAITSEQPQELEPRWLSMGDSFPLAFIARGDSFCDELAPQQQSPLDEEVDLWQLVCGALRRRRNAVRMKELEMMMIRGEASQDDMKEYQAIATQLKR